MCILMRMIHTRSSCNQRQSCPSLDDHRVICHIISHHKLRKTKGDNFEAQNPSSEYKVTLTATMISNTMDTLRQYVAESSDLKALLTLSAVALAVVFPLGLVWNPYLFSVGYAAAVAATTFTLIHSFDVPMTLRGNPKPQEILALIVFLHGLRLTIFLLYREWSVKKMRDQVRSFHNKYPSYMLVVLASVLSLLYASMVSPLFYALRRPPTDGTNVTIVWTGICLAFAGFVLEAIADEHKSKAKRSHGIVYGEKRFVGPTTGLYGICRHPNFAGELLFWTGLFMAGLPSFHASVTSWISALTGWVCIVNIMITSTRNLDQKQEEWYHSQPQYEEWKKNVKGSLLPRIPFPTL